jgi:4-amino-4-deoxy-L-arabinose transferase-like glycosyltransferase
LPVLLASLAAALLVCAVAQAAGGARAGVIAGAAFLLAPLIFEKAAVAETDIVITAASFAAFAVWWAGEREGGVGLGRWLACAALLAAAALAKGPVGVGFFAAGIGAYLAWHRRAGSLALLVATVLLALAPLAVWAQLVADQDSTGMWRREMRMTDWTVGGWLAGLPGSAAQLIGGQLPWLLLACVAWLPRWRRALSIDGRLPQALLLYAAAFLAVLVLWPGARARYGMPAVPAVAVAAGLGGAALWSRTGWIRLGLPAAATSLVLVHLLVTSGWGPFAREQPLAVRAAGKEIAAAVAADPAPIYVIDGDIDYNLAFYTHRQVLALSPAALGALDSPGWLLAKAGVIDGLRGTVPGAVGAAIVDAILPGGAHYVLARFEPRGPSHGTPQVH